MPLIEFGDRDLLRGVILTPAWYRVRIDSVGEKPSNDGGSTNYPVEATVKFNAENQDASCAGVPLDWNFNSKAIGFAVGFLESITGEKPEKGKRYELAKAAGSELEVYVENDLYQGRTVNRVNHKYRPAR